MSSHIQANCKYTNSDSNFLSPALFTCFQRFKELSKTAEARKLLLAELVNFLNYASLGLPDKQIPIKPFCESSMHRPGPQRGASV